MNAKQDHQASLVSITGKSNQQLHLLANLYYEPIDPESVLSIIISLSHKPDVDGDTIYSTETWCTSLDESDGGTLYVVSMEGEMHVYRNESWHVLDLQAPNGLNSVWAANDNESFAVGLEGERIHVRGDQFEVTRDNNRVRLNAVHGSSTAHVMAVGDHGLAFRFDGKQWHKVELPTNVNLLGVYCLAEDQVLISGAGVLFRWDGDAWFDIEADGLNISDIAYWNKHFYLACGSNGVYFLQDDELVIKKELTVYRLNSIGDRLFGVGNRMVTQFDGEGWWGGDLDI
jgi:hypothetical protein